MAGPSHLHHAKQQTTEDQIHRRSLYQYWVAISVAVVSPESVVKHRRLLELGSAMVAATLICLATLMNLRLAEVSARERFMRKDLGVLGLASEGRPPSTHHLHPKKTMNIKILREMFLQPLTTSVCRSRSLTAFEEVLRMMGRAFDVKGQRVVMGAQPLVPRQMTPHLSRG